MNARLNVVANKPLASHHRPFASAPARQTSQRQLLKTFASELPTPQIPEQAAPEVAAAWKECAARLESLGLEEEKANIVVGKAFGWAGQAYLRHTRVEDRPSLTQLEAALEFLQELGISDEADLTTLITKFPECLGLEIELMEGNIEKLKKAFSMKGAALAGAIKRKPRVLGATVDCEGNCAGECTRCFAQF